MNQATNRVHTEVCIAADDIQLMQENIATAVEAGAERIELCASMQDDGLTPTKMAIKSASKVCQNGAELLVMIRPAADSFSYSLEQLSLMEKQIEVAANAGADGVVLGTLTTSNKIDPDALLKLVAVAEQHALAVTFHRAFDCIEDWRPALEQLIAVGVKRVLTSGTAWASGLGAMQGLEKIGEMLSFSRGQIEIVVGGGVSVQNAADITRYCSPLGQHFSLHTYSGVLTDDKVDTVKVSHFTAI